jgi:hypothetical protein
MQAQPSGLRSCLCGCGIQFIPRRSDHLYISEAHKQKARRARIAQIKRTNEENELRNKLPKAFQESWDNLSLDFFPEIKKALYARYLEGGLHDVALTINALAIFSNNSYNEGVESTPDGKL